MMWDNMHTWGWIGLGMIHIVLFWILIILGIVALVRWLSGSPSDSRPREKTPLDILKERYARGEIEREEFEQKKRDLE